jgi:hypothetical protein
MKRRRSLYARPEVIRGQQCAEARLGRWSDTSSCLVAAVITVALAVLPSLSRPWLLRLKPQTPAQRRARSVRRAAFVVVRSRMSECLPCRSPVPCPHPFGFAIACRVKWMVSGRTRRGRRCPETVRSWRPAWTLDTTARTSDGGPGFGTFRHRAQVQVVMTGGPDAGSGWGGRRQACPLPSCPVRARTSRPRSWPWPAGQTHGRTLGAGGVRRLAAAVRTGSTHRLGGHLELGMSGGPDGREVGHVRRPASQCWCPREELIGGDGVQAGVRRPRPGGSARPDGLRACRARHGEVLEVPTGRSRVGCAGPTSGSGAEACLRAIDRPDGRVWGGWGQWVSAGNSPALALAGRPGLCSAAGVPAAGVIGSRRANRSARLAALEPVSRIQRTHPISKQTKVLVHLPDPTDLRYPSFHLLLRRILSLMCPIIYPHILPSLVLSSP